MAANPKTQTSVERGLRHYDLVNTRQLDELSHLHSDTSPIVSVYLNVPLSEKKKQELHTQLNHFIDERGEQLKHKARDTWHQFQPEAERLMNWLTEEYDGSGRGLALFSSIPNKLWRVFRLPRAVRDEFILSDRPYVSPLVALAAEYETYLTLLLNQETARLFTVYMGEIEEYEQFADDLPRKSKGVDTGAEDKIERHHEVYVLRHVEHAIRAAEQIWTRDQARWLVIGGTDDPLAQLRAHLPKALLEKIAGQVSVAVEAPAVQVLDAVLKVEQANEARIEAERVDALLTAALGKGPGVLGLADTLEAIVEGRVMILIVEENFQQPGFECPNDHYLTIAQTDTCPLCGTRLDPQVDIVERAVERALDQDAQIEMVRGAARDKLAEHGHIGALLRYNIEPAPAESASIANS